MDVTQDDQIIEASKRGLRELRKQLDSHVDGASEIRGKIRAAIIEAKSRGLSTNEIAKALSWTPGRVRQLLNGVPEYKEKA